MSGDVAMQEMIAKVLKLGTMPEEVAKAAVPFVELEARRTAAAGTTPDGKAWSPRKADGKPALVNAAAAVSVRALGGVVQLFLRGTSTGSAKVQAIQNVKRAILPSKGEGIPDGLAKAITKAARQVFQRITGAA